MKRTAGMIVFDNNSNSAFKETNYKHKHTTQASTL